MLKFQFPSNGKAYPKPETPSVDTTETEFQFPSNGKAYPKRGRTEFGFPNSTEKVSIPFKRESISKAGISFLSFKIF